VIDLYPGFSSWPKKFSSSQTARRGKRNAGFQGLGLTWTIQVC